MSMRQAAEPMGSVRSPMAYFVLVATSGRQIIAGSTIAGVFSLVVLAELAHFRAAPHTIPARRNPAVIVLGYPPLPGGRPHPVQRWRLKVAKRTIERFGVTRVVLSGGATRHGPTEAAVMAKLAKSIGIDPTITILESNSTSTWANIENSSRLVGGCDVVILVSDPIHAARARRYWLRQHPSDSQRVFVTPCVGFGAWWIKVPTFVEGAVRAARSSLQDQRWPKR